MDSFLYPDCPSCCQVRINQGISTTIGTGSLCAPCKNQENYINYTKSPEYIAWKENMPLFTDFDEYTLWIASNPAPIFITED